MDKEIAVASSLSVTFHGNKNAKDKVVFLHGIASSRDNWTKIINELGNSYCLVTVDLLGFGDSPAPFNANYSVDTHAKAVILSLNKANVKDNIFLVGHSMGCIISTHIAHLYPEKIKNILLVSLPIYKGWEFTGNTLSFKEKLIHRGYFQIYDYFREDALFTSVVGTMISKLIGRKSGFKLSARNYVAFNRSLKNCIEFQSTEKELAEVKIPVSIYYGVFDIFVIKRYIKQLGLEYNHINVVSVKSGHIVIKTMAKAVAKDIKNTIRNRGL